MSDASKKRLKAEAKAAKKAAKLEHKAAKRGGAGAAQSAPADAKGKGASPAVRFAEMVRGVLYVILGASLIVALFLGQRGAIISLEDIIENLFAAWTGKIVLGVIAVALVIYGFKHLKFVR